AQQLKSENDQESAAQFNKALNSKFHIPGWIKDYSLYGDFRGRFDDRTTPNPAQEDNIRLRYRLRVGLTVDMKDNLELGFRLGSSDPNANGYGGSPLSNNTTLQANATKKFIYVDEAYGRWTPINDGSWTVAATMGKMPNDYPFQVTPMVLDPDYTPEGGAVESAYKLNDDNSLLLNAAGFVLAYSGSSGENMSFLYGAQALWNAKWSHGLSSSLGVAAFDIVNRGLLTTGAAGAGNTGNAVDAGGAPIYNMNPIVLDASLTDTLDSFPVYPGKFPIKLWGEYIVNPGAPGSGGMTAGQPNGNQGYEVGLTFGAAKKKGTWDIGYRYESLDANAWWAQVVNDDNLAYNAGFKGGTNIKGHLVTADYALSDALVFSFTCYVNSMIGNTNPGGSSSSAIHAMADLMWKF
ncbi:MAG: putative porin, partial [Verrucomicrobia bacterium]|nr:putative porin [Verrucomicrobiota bacterium]